MTRPYTLSSNDLDLAELMAGFHLDGKTAGAEIEALRGNILLDDSVQGWSGTALKSAASTPGGLRIDEDFECPPSDEPVDIGNQAFNRIIVLGYYRRHPRQIVLFPEAIRLVANLPDFVAAGIDFDLLFQSVLLHEIGHWLTLIPGCHHSRIARCQSPPNEEAETLTELLNWLALTGANEEGNSQARRLLKCQHFKRNRGPVWQYQVYPFWLAASGIVTKLDQLSGCHKANLQPQALEWLKRWMTRAEEFPDHQVAIKALRSAIFPRSEAFQSFLPCFRFSAAGLSDRITDLLSYWTDEWKTSQIVDDDDGDMLDL